MFVNSLTVLLFAGWMPFVKHAFALSSAATIRKRQERYSLKEMSWPPVTVLKPLCGLEPGLFEALESFCKIDYPRIQIVFGLHCAEDPALQVVRKLMAIYPDIDISIIVSSSLPCQNRKVANLINMTPSAAYDVLVISDSDMHVNPNYLKNVVLELMTPGVGLVTTLYTGKPAYRSIAADLGLAYINWYFIPGALLGAALGRQDCFGATMALRRTTLDEIGNFHMIGNHLADDAALGRLVRGLGLTVKLAPIIPTTSIPEVRISSLLQHELRWAVTMRSVAPISFGISLIQYSTVWAGLALVMSPLDPIFVGNFLLLTAIQWRLAASVDKGLGITTPISPFLIPFRELLSVGVTICSFFSSDVKWRGQDFRVGKPRQWFTRVHVRRCLTVGNIYEIGEIGND